MVEQVVPVSLDDGKRGGGGYESVRMEPLILVFGETRRRGRSEK